MAEVNIGNMEDNAILFEEKMGFPHDSDGLELSEEQLVNFLLLCHQEHVLGDEHDEDEMYEDDCDCEGEEDCDCHHNEMMEMPDGRDVKVKVMKLDGGSVHDMMNKLLGG